MFMPFLSFRQFGKITWLTNAICVTLILAPAYAQETKIDRPSSSKPATVLPAEKFFGRASLGYAAAKKIPDICSKLFCYCGCDLTDNHSTLLDCFTSDHGADCQICQEEAILALKMKNEGKSLAAIQKAVDQRYLKEYTATFSKPSKALMAYRATRLWHPDYDEDKASKLSLNANAPPRRDGGACCGHKK